MSDSKWIDGLTSDMPVDQAALHVLEVRLGAVLRHLPQALNEADRDTEHVHQLRVSTRRAAAAVRIFRGCLPAKIHKRVRKYLRRIRRSAGAARDADVFLQTLAERLPRARPNQRSGFDFLFGVGRQRRLAAQRELQAANADDTDQGDTLLASVLAHLERPDRQTLAELAAETLTVMLDDLERAAGGDLSAYEELHQVRILGKRLRYAMEIFACCFPHAFRQRLYPAVEAMQEILGDANDSHVAVQELERLRNHLESTEPTRRQRWQPGIDSLLTFHRRRLPRQRRAFDAWLKKWQTPQIQGSLRRMLG